MRVRKKKNAGKRIEALSEMLIRNVNEFENMKNINLEIGCGKGMFICTLAAQHPDINYVAVEKVESVLVTAMERASSANIKNVKFFMGDIMLLDELENKEFVKEIYLNFSDPWPRGRHAKRRLTAERFLALYKKLLMPGGLIRMKTDNENLFDFSLESFEENGFLVSGVTRDLHSKDTSENIMTEYESNFVSQGLPIYALNATLKD